MSSDIEYENSENIKEIKLLETRTILTKVVDSYFRITVAPTPHVKLVGLTQRGNPGLSAFELAQKNGFIGTEQQWLDSLKETSNSRYDFAISVQGPFFAGEEIWGMVCVTPFKILANLEGSIVKCKTRPLSSFTILLQKNGIQFGCIVFTSDSDYAYFDSVETTFYETDELLLVADAIVDPNLTNSRITIAAYRYLYGG